MKIYEFHQTWNWLRVVAVVLAVILTIGLAIKAHSFNMEMDYRGPGSEIEAFERQANDRESEKANERVNENDRNNRDSTQNDRERANEYQRNNGV
jgi:hypothetical protein